MTADEPRALTKTVFSGTPAEVGHAHGRLWRHEIPVIASIRTELTIARSDLPSRAEVTRLASRHLPVLRAFDEPLFEELRGIADAAGVTLEELVVLNHYTDLRDIRRPVWDAADAPDPGGCSTALLPRTRGRAAVTGQTWDMHGSSEPFVRLVEVRTPGQPNACVLTLTGCLGMAGLNEHGVGVLINNLSSTDARVGIIWSALVRRLLRETTARGAADVLASAPLGSGHHYLICDGREAFAVETSGQRQATLAHATAADGPWAPILHTNHCLVENMQQTERPPATSTTWERFSRLSSRVSDISAATAASGGVSVEAMAGLFADHDGDPRSLCLHLATPQQPHAVSTCGAIVFDHVARRVLAVRGCAVENPWVATTVGEDAADVVAIDGSIETPQ